MKRVKSKLIIAGIGLVAIFSSTTIAQPQNAFLRTYFSSSNYSTVVGFYSQTCTNSNYSGARTAYYLDDIRGQCYPELDANGNRTVPIYNIPMPNIDIPDYCPYGRKSDYTCKKEYE